MLLAARWVEPVLRRFLLAEIPELLEDNAPAFLVIVPRSMPWDPDGRRWTIRSGHFLTALIDGDDVFVHVIDVEAAEAELDRLLAP